jgi:hypothetical protein
MGRAARSVFHRLRLWNYLNLPFLLARPGFTVHDVTHYRSGDAAWQRVSYSYPDEIATHNRTQALHIDSHGRVRRLDYSSEIFGGARRHTSRRSTKRSTASPSRYGERSSRAVRTAVPQAGPR